MDIPQSSAQSSTQSSVDSHNPETHQEAIKYCTDHEITPELLLFRCSRTGSIREMKVAKLAGVNIPWDHWKLALRRTVEKGHLNCATLLNEWQEDMSQSWGERYLCVLMNVAASRNQIGMMIWLRTLIGDTFNYRRALGFAAQEGHIDVMEFIKDSEENLNADFAVKMCVSRNQIKSLETLKGWGLVDYDVLLMEIAGYSLLRDGNDKLELMFLAKEWGATNFGPARQRAIKYENHELVKVLAMWEKESESD